MTSQMLRLAQSALTRSSRSYSSRSGPERKVAILGAAGGIGQILSMRMKLNPLLFRLALYAIAGTPGVAADFSHINTRSESGSKDSEDHLSTTSAFFVLRVKVFHRDVRKNTGNSDLMIPYEMLSNLIRSEIIERENR